MKTRASIRRNEQGMVSITVTLVMIIVISLIVVGFAQVVRRNSREALDRQLSSQAYYAAETGINDVYQKVIVDQTPIDFTGNPYGSNCNAFISSQNLSNKLNDDGSVAYTCLLVSSGARTVVQSVPYGANETVPLQVSPAPGSLTFEWQPGQASGNVNNCNGKFTPADAAGNYWLNCPFGILRLDLYLYDAAAGATDAAGMAKATTTIFFVPRPSGSSRPITFGNPQKSVYIVDATCSSVCDGMIRGINGTDYYARLTAVYEGLGNVTISPSNPASMFTGFLVVDSTGKAQDELRRVQVRIPLQKQTTLDLPQNALASGGNVCKRYLIMGGNDTANQGGDSNLPADLCPNP